MHMVNKAQQKQKGNIAFPSWHSDGIQTNIHISPAILLMKLKKNNPKFVQSYHLTPQSSSFILKKSHCAHKYDHICAYNVALQMSINNTHPITSCLNDENKFQHHAIIDIVFYFLYRIYCR